MIISKERQQLILPVNPAILETIPHAKKFKFDGKHLVAVNHGVDEVRVLRNLGLQAPSPIEYYYNWPGRFPPRKHQRETASFFTSYPRVVCLNAPGTGKTLSALWAADYLLSTQAIKNVLIIAPLSTLKVVWGKELIWHFPHRKFNIVTGQRAKRERLILDEKAQFCIINHDGFSTMPDIFSRFDLIIYDEVTAMKNPSTRRFKLFSRFMRNYTPRLWAMTGTPITDNPPDVWPVSSLLGCQALPRSYTQFKEITMQRVSPFRWIPRENALDICKQVLKPSIRFSLEECTDLPQLTYVDRECELTEEQQDAYDELKATAEIAGHAISAANAAVLYSKLLQVCCGVAYDSDKKDVLFDDKNRVDTLIELLEEIGDKAIVFVPLRNVQSRLVNLLIKENYDAVEIHGGVTGKKRNDIFDLFQNSDNIKVLVAHPRVASHGLDLTRSKNIIWYAPYPSLEAYEQANARIRRLSSKVGKTMVHHIVSTNFERSIYKRLQERKKVLTNFLSLMKGMNE
jgi:SNF2 family DNA or RNA helicase